LLKLFGLIEERAANVAQKAAEAAAQKAAAASEEATKMLQMAKVAEDAKFEALQPPILKFPIEAGSARRYFHSTFPITTRRYLSLIPSIKMNL
jgi:hypothetical protein